MIQQFHTWVYIWKKKTLIQKDMSRDWYNIVNQLYFNLKTFKNKKQKRYMHPQHSQQHYLQQPRYGCNPNAHQQMNG